MIMKSIERLEETIEQETAALLAHDISSLEEFNRRKSQSLLELTRLARTLDSKSFDAATLARIVRLKEKLETNYTVLSMNLRAVQEVSSIISGAIQNAESDGTYSANIRPVG